MERSKAESFTAYLEAKHRWEKRQAATQPATGGTAFSILSALAAHSSEPMEVIELQSASGMSLTTFAEAVKRLQGSGYVTASGPPGAESAALNRLGTDVASLARPA